MNKWISAALAAGTMVVASPAMAALDGGSSSAANPFVIVIGPGGSNTQSGGEIVNAFNNGSGSFTDYFEFTVPSEGVVGSQAGTVTVSATAGIVFKFLTLNGVTTNLVTAGGSPGSTQISLSGIGTIGNPQKFSLGYDVMESGSYTASVSWTKSAVPEPASWALMILGFGVVGYSLRRRPSVRFAQAI